MTLQEQFGPIDIYLFDQILRGNIHPGMCILDAGCGSGRNLIYLLRNGATIFALDAQQEAIEHVRHLAQQLAPHLPRENFRVAPIEQMPFADALVDVVLCNAVLHFARDRRHFLDMMDELWRVLRPGGLLFCRLSSRIGMDFEEIRPDIYRVGGQQWFLVDEAMLLDWTHQHNAELIDPLKTTVVQAHRCMTTWVLRKPQEP